VIIFIDIDGTISDASERQKFLTTPGKKKDWASFHRPDLVAADPPINEARAALAAILDNRSIYEPILLTGRPDALRQVTEIWLLNHFNIKTTEELRSDTAVPLLMRPEGDYSSSKLYKMEQISDVVDFYPTDSMMFIDDDLRNKDMYLEFGTFLHAPECWKVVHF
jgi:hypothetical protein